MKKYIEYLHQSAKSIEYTYQTFQSPLYEEWKQNNYLLWSQTSFRPLLLLSSIIILVRLSLLADQIEVQITMAVLFTLNMVIYFLQPYVNTKKYYIIQLFPFIQQQTVSWFCIVLTNYDKSYQILFAMVTISSLSLYYSVFYKLMAIITYVLLIQFFANLNQNEGLYLSIIIMIVHIIRKEFQEMHYYKKLEALFFIIDSIPHAMCIIHKNKDILLYSNKYFENLSSRLQGTNNSETEQSPEKSHIYSVPQLKFLQNLQLNEFNQQNVQVLDFDEVQFDDDSLKIKKVIYGKAENFNNSQKSDNNPPNRQTIQLQQIFKSFKNPSEIQRKTYTSDVTIQVELKYQPQNQVSAQFKSHRKQSSNLQIQTRRKVSCEQLIQQKNSLVDSLYQSPQHLKSSTTTLDQKMKFIVHVMENNKLFDKEEALQIYFIQDMQPLMLKNKLEKLESQKKNLLRSISHELLTNLNAAYGFIKQSQDKVKRKENCQIELEYSYRYIKLQLFKIYDIFDYRDILDERLVMKKDKFDIQGVINECVDLVRDQYEKKLLQMEVEIPENNYQIIGDRQRLCQVILNLIGNAIKFTYKGKISIIVKKKQLMNSMPNSLDDDEINSFEGQADNLIEIYVKDTGIGMSEKELSILQKKLHIFDEDEKVSQESVGIGLGLSVCKSIISLMTKNINYGVLQVHSIKDEGSDFFFSLAYNDDRSQTSIVRKSNHQTIPLMDAQSSTQQVKVLNYNKKQLQISDRLGISQLQIEITPPNQCQCKRLLIVDDELFNIEVLQHMTTQMGYDNDTALNGKQALQLIKDKLDSKKCNQFCQGYHAILMDINMPIMGGWETVQRLRQMECELRLTKTIPVIAVTAFCSIQDQQQCIKEGFNSVIVKPATLQILGEVFNDLDL